MLKEIISRRLKHKEWQMPQVILIDGGKGQLNAAIERFKIHDSRFMNNTRIISLAKRKNELFLEGKEKPVLLKNLPQETANLILRIRDEAHRFAITYHKKLRSNNFLG
jgi:excinuclease ABC subunit C